MNVLDLAPLVERLAKALRRHLPDYASIDVDDLRQAGWIAALEGSARFQDRGVAKLETYLGTRIRGAMIDEVRRWCGCNHVSTRGRPPQMVDIDDVQCEGCAEFGPRLSGDELTPREALVLAIYADAEGNRTRAVERVMGGRVFADIASARRKLEALAA